MNEFLTPKQVADILHVSHKTIRRWCLNGEIPYSKFGRSVRIKASDFKKYCQDNEI